MQHAFIYFTDIPIAFAYTVSSVIVGVVCLAIGFYIFQILLKTH